MINEIWKDVEGYEGKYKISNQGKVKSLNYRGHGVEALLKPKTDKDGYLEVRLCVNNVSRYVRVHRLVASTFIENDCDKPQVNHINEVKDDNRVENLEWMTNKENVNHGTATKRRSNTMTKYKDIVGVNVETGKVIRFSTVNEAGENGFSTSVIRGILNGSKRGKYSMKTNKGYKWYTQEKWEVLEDAN